MVLRHQFVLNCSTFILIQKGKKWKFCRASIHLNSSQFTSIHLNSPQSSDNFRCSCQITAQLSGSYLPVLYILRDSPYLQLRFVTKWNLVCISLFISCACFQSYLITRSASAIWQQKNRFTPDACKKHALTLTHNHFACKRRHRRTFSAQGRQIGYNSRTGLWLMRGDR
jgi:hypothetical protein